MRKPAWLIAPALLGVALATSACGGNSDNSSATSSSSASSSTSTSASASASSSGAPVRGNADLVIWTDETKYPGVKKVADAFAAAQGITVAVQTATDLQTQFVTANSAGNGPDVVVGAHDWIGNLVQNGAITPLQLTPDQLKGYSPKAVEATTYNGQLYGVPYELEALALYRNTAVAPTEPKTMDDAIDEGIKAVKAGKVSSALNLPVGQLGDAYHMEPLLSSFGGYIFASKPGGGYNASDVGIGKSGSIAAAKEIASLADKKVLRTSISDDNTISLFAAGKAAFLVSGPWALPDVTASKVKFAVQPLPPFAGEKASQPFMGAQAFMVASKGKNQAFAQQFVTGTDGINSETAQKTLDDTLQLPPAMISVQKQVTDKNIAVFATAANAAEPMPSIPEMAAVWAPLGKAYAAIVGGSNPTSTIVAAGKTITSAVKSAG